MKVFRVAWMGVLNSLTPGPSLSLSWLASDVVLLDPPPPKSSHGLIELLDPPKIKQ